MGQKVRGIYRVGLSDTIVEPDIGERRLTLVG